MAPLLPRRLHNIKRADRTQTLTTCLRHRKQEREWLRHKAFMSAMPAILAWTIGANLGDAPPPEPPTPVPEWRFAFAREVDRRLEPPEQEQVSYASLAKRTLQAAGRQLTHPQWVLVIDRHAHVQAALLYLAAPEPMPWHWIGAAPVSTGRPGGFEHFLTPLGVHEHRVENPDFRSEGTRNVAGVRGYGVAGMRVFDFGWVEAQRTWDPGRSSPMRLQLHATDPQRLEPRLGQRESKGCIRISASLNRFLDHYSVLDADYDAELASGRHHWVLEPRRVPSPWAGRFVVVLETPREARPAWSPGPDAPRPPAQADVRAGLASC